MNDSNHKRMQIKVRLRPRRTTARNNAENTINNNWYTWLQHLSTANSLFPNRKRNQVYNLANGCGRLAWSAHYSPHLNANVFTLTAILSLVFYIGNKTFSARAPTHTTGRRINHIAQIECNEFKWFNSGQFTPFRSCRFVCEKNLADIDSCDRKSIFLWFTPRSAVSKIFIYFVCDFFRYFCCFLRGKFWVAPAAPRVWPNISASKLLVV